MSNVAYLRGRRLEWAIQKLFRESGYAAMRTAGSHGIADVVICRDTIDPLALNEPITTRDVNIVLDGWVDIHDQKKIIDPFLFGKQKFLPRGGQQKIFMTPAQVWLLQMKTVKGK